jgi:hydroxyacylglutathione hydrolase
MEKVADGVWLLRGDTRKAMNIYFLEDGDGVVQFDAGTKAMVRQARAAAQELGGLKRIVLGHAHADHRGTAPSMGAPVFCHPDEVADAESDAAIAPYMDISTLPAPARWIYPMLLRRWDGGAVKIDGTVSEGDEVAGFRVIHFPGHAPGLIGLWRESDRVAIVSDVVYLIDSTKMGRSLPEGEASVPHPAWGWDHAKAKESVRRLAALEPALVCTGHDEPLRGGNLRETLERAAEKY